MPCLLLVSWQSAERCYPELIVFLFLLIPLSPGPEGKGRGGEVIQTLFTTYRGRQNLEKRDSRILAVS